MNYLTEALNVMIEGSSYWNKPVAKTLHYALETSALTFFGLYVTDGNPISFAPVAMLSFVRGAQVGRKNATEEMILDFEKYHIDELREDLKGQPLRAARQADETLAGHEDGLAEFMSTGKGRE